MDRLRPFLKGDREREIGEMAKGLGLFVEVDSRGTDPAHLTDMLRLCYAYSAPFRRPQEQGAGGRLGAGAFRVVEGPLRPGLGHAAPRTGISRGPGASDRLAGGVRHPERSRHEGAERGAGVETTLWGLDLR